MRKTLIVAAAALLVPGMAQAAAFTNGGFESGTAPGDFLQVDSPNSSAITGWTVESGSVDYIGSYWTAAEGSRSIDLSGNNAGTLSQTFDTTIGKSYVVNYMLAGNPAGGTGTKSLNVFATGGPVSTASFEVTSANTLQNMGWTSKSYSFTATAAETKLSFQSLISNGYGAALDNVSITAAVPEPATWALMIGGFGLVGGTMRRRRAGGLATA